MYPYNPIFLKLNIFSLLDLNLMYNQFQ